MSDTQVIDSCKLTRGEQLECWERLPLTKEQRYRVLKAIMEEKEAKDNKESDEEKKDKQTQTEDEKIVC